MPQAPPWRRHPRSLFSLFSYIFFSLLFVYFCSFILCFDLVNASRSFLFSLFPFFSSPCFPVFIRYSWAFLRYSCIFLSYSSIFPRCSCIFPSCFCLFLSYLCSFLRCFSFLCLSLTLMHYPNSGASPKQRV